MPSLKIVLDTNALLRSVSRRSAYAIILDKLYENVNELYLTNDILLEYEEKITAIFSKETAELIIGAVTFLDNVKRTDIHFHLNLITADTDDKHFNVLKSISFPAINVISLAEFKDLLLSL
jgi:uncharacterized protein